MSLKFDELYEVVRRLRAPDGCPWDKEQTPETLCDDLLEEAGEVVEAIQDTGAEKTAYKDHIKEELGDLLFMCVMVSYMHEQEGSFTVEDVLQGAIDKFIRRHPHVFGDVQVKDTAEVLRNWERIKVEVEGRPPKQTA
ncbi:MAG: hypothetical protein LBM77_08865 [Spirochaetaceae bacterium]|jgi:tetrapyrrole methylase family protein/MazG family protein|nr:hypothetical protein [Spirochaetaceae bacterium]